MIVKHKISSQGFYLNFHDVRVESTINAIIFMPSEDLIEKLRKECL
jgi:hypothetical protein